MITYANIRILAGGSYAYLIPYILHIAHCIEYRTTTSLSNQFDLPGLWEKLCEIKNLYFIYKYIKFINKNYKYEFNFHFILYYN